MADNRSVPPTFPADRGQARGPFAPIYVPFGVHPRATLLEALRRALVVAEAHPEESRFLFEMHLDAP